jgi:Predicted transcriptional regulators
VGRNRSGVLELAVLGLLNGTPMHGYELRKRLYTVLGAFRALSYGRCIPACTSFRTPG